MMEWIQASQQWKLMQGMDGSVGAVQAVVQDAVAVGVDVGDSEIAVAAIGEGAAYV